VGFRLGEDGGVLTVLGWYQFLNRLLGLFLLHLFCDFLGVREASSTPELVASVVQDAFAYKLMLGSLIGADATEWRLVVIWFWFK
jgi:hypothetical protein